MSKVSRRGKNRRNHPHSQKKPTNTSKWLDKWNFDLHAGPGCHIARHTMETSWVLEWESIDPLEYQNDEIPDIAIDTEDQTLSLCNIHDEYVVAYISVYSVILRDAQRRVLRAGTTTSNAGLTRTTTTLIVLCPPRTFAHLCYIDLYDEPTGQLLSLEQIELDSDVQVWNRHPDPTDTHPTSIGFPLQGGPFYCTQGEGGVLTHFFAGNLHAVDFRCPVGTPLLAVADGTVIETRDNNTLSGVAVSNLFEWNSILIQVNVHGISTCRSDSGANNSAQSSDEQPLGIDPLFVEYVHIEKSFVQPGDVVRKGQVIGASGSVGFSPEPHLHFAAYRTADPTAATVRVYFEGGKDDRYLPRAGQWYDSTGLVCQST